MDTTTEDVGVKMTVNITQETGCTQEVREFEPSCAEFLEGKLRCFCFYLFIFGVNICVDEKVI